MLLMTYRSDELHRSHPLRPVAHDLGARPQCRADRAVPADAGGGGRAAGGNPGASDRPPQVVEAVFERSQGNAYLVEEVLGIIQGGRECRTTCRRPCATCCSAAMELLPDDAKRVARAASAAGTVRAGAAARLGGRARRRPLPRRAARGRGAPPAARRRLDPGLRVPALADAGRDLPRHAARRAGAAARVVRRSAEHATRARRSRGRTRCWRTTGTPRSTCHAPWPPPSPPAGSRRSTPQPMR